MLTPRSFAFLQGGRTTRRARDEAQRHVQGEPAVRLLPGLLDIPLAPDPAMIMGRPGGLALCGPPGCGRSLALLQLQHRWAGTGGPAIALSLAADDAPNLSPRAVVAGAIHRVGLPPSYAEGGQPMLLLIDDWEDLPADRRAVWRGYALAAAGWAAARVVICLPPGEEWPRITSLALAAPDDDTLTIWLGCLLPGHDSGPIIAALGREPLAALRSSVGDLLLMALIYPITGAPSSRPQLYEQAYALTRPLLDEADGRLSVGRAAMRHYRLARGLVGGADFAALADLPAHEVAAVAPLAAGLLGDPRPVLSLLWAAGEPSPGALRGLAACLRERPADAPEQGLRLVELLAARDERELLSIIGPGLPDMFAALGHGDQERASRALYALAKHQPVHPLADLPLIMIDRQDAGETLRWAAADILAARPAPPAGIDAPPAAADRLALAARAHAIALAAPALRAELLGAALRPGLDALIAGAGGAGRRAAACAALIADPDCPDELRALALTGAPGHAEGVPLLQRALADRSPALRRAALAALAIRPADEAIRLLGAALATAGDEEAVGDLLAAAAQIARPEATGLIARYALGERGGVEQRIAALRLLAGRPGGPSLLLRFLAAAGMPAPLRAAAAHLLGAASALDAAPQLRRALLGDGPPLLRRAAALALATLARAPGGGHIAVAALIEAISRPEPDAALTCSVAAALAAAGAVVAAPALSTLLDLGRPAALRASWLAAVPALAHTPVDLWPTIPLDPCTRAVLLDSLATGDTADDQPGSLDELGRRQAEMTATAAADALATLAELRPDLADELCARIRRAILHAPGARPPTGLLDALARAAGDRVAAELEALLDSPAGTPAIRWAAIERLGHAPCVATWALGRLRAGGDDPFTLGKLAMILGDLGEQRALPTLRQIAASGGTESYLRDSAVVAMGKIGGADADTALRAIMAASDAPEQLRALAVGALPQPLSDETRRALRQVVRAEGSAMHLADAIGLAFARASAREATPLLLRAAQSERAQDAARAIAALGSLGDQSAAPTLVRISQSATAVPGLRLAAVAALLELDGPAQLPLLRSYLDSPLPPIRLRAHQILARIAPGDPQLIAPVSDMSAPLMLRVDALERLMASHPTLSLAGAILKHTDEPPQLRICAARALGHSGRPEAARTLLEALGVGGSPLLRRRCVLALGELAAAPGEAAQAARAGLATLAQDAAAPAEIRHWAAEIILDRALRQTEAAIARV